MYKLYNPHSAYQGEFYEFFFDGQLKGVAGVIETDRKDWANILRGWGYRDVEESENLFAETPPVEETEAREENTPQASVEETPQKRGRGRPRKNPVE